MTANYKLDQETKGAIMELVSTCSRLNLGNVNFSYYRDNVDFYLCEYKHHWGLTVRQGRSRDIYTVDGGVIDYDYSEID